MKSGAPTVELPEADVRELVAAAQELHDEATHVFDPRTEDFLNCLDEPTERRFVLALDEIKAKVGL